MKKILLLAAIFMVIASFAFTQEAVFMEIIDWQLFVWAGGSGYSVGAFVMDEQQQILEEVAEIHFDGENNFPIITTTVVGHMYTFYMIADDADTKVVVIAWEVPNSTMVVRSLAQGNNVMLGITKNE